MSIFTTEPTREDRHRAVTLTWKLGDTTDHYGAPCTAAAQLHVSHNSDRKAFTATLQRTNLKSERGFTIAMFEVFGGTRVRLSSVPAARYSAKALEAAVESALAELRSRLDDPAVVAAADPTSPA